MRAHEGCRPPSISGRAAIGLLGFVEELGVEAEPLLGKAQLTRAQVEDASGWLPLHRFVYLLELAARASQDDCFGAHFAARYPLHHTGLAGYVTVNASTIGKGCRALARYYAVLADASEIALRAQGTRVCLSYGVLDDSVWPRRHDAEAMIGILLAWLRQTLGPSWAPDEVCFEHARPRGAGELERLFKARIRFDSAHNGLWFPRALLERAMEPVHADLGSLIEPYLEQLLAKKRSSEDLREHVVATMRRSLDAPSLRGVARTQGVSQRTLQRRLRKHGASFHALLERTRHESSIALLGDGTLS
ncbi:MAG TPA: AraC family transcriptional regulator ligand-binding domain-containing protein, partial [Polyangiales bacterium]